MKTREMFFSILMAGTLFTACQEDVDQPAPEISSGEQTVQFDIDASAIKHEVKSLSLRALNPTYTREAFSIYAFKKESNSNNYIYQKTINLSGFTYDPNVKKLTGKDQLPIGTYKFLPAYGLVNQPALLTIPTWADQFLTDNLDITYNGATGLSEVFLQTGNVNSITSYDLNPDISQTVTATLRRAVSRVDIMFIKGIKNGDGSYTELPYPAGEDVFGGKTLEGLNLTFTNLNNKVNFFGLNYTTQPIASSVVALSNFNASNLVMGTANNTRVGTGSFNDYDNIVNTDVIYGAAHIAGPFLFPNNTDAKTVGLNIEVNLSGGINRNILVDVDANHKLPLERNKVTIVKIYVLEGNVGTAEINFEVEIITAWDGYHVIEGETEGPTL